MDCCMRRRKPISCNIRVQTGLVILMIGSQLQDDCLNEVEQLLKGEVKGKLVLLLSTAEGEPMALASATQEAIWHRQHSLE